MLTARRRRPLARLNIFGRPLSPPRKPGRKPKYPFAGMKIGDSFLQPWERGEPNHVIQNRVVCAAIVHLGPGNFETHQEAGGCRVRRTDKRHKEQERIAQLLS